MSELKIFYEEHVDKVYKFFYIQCLDVDIAEDLTSQTFMAYIEYVSDAPVRDTKKYLYGIMRNTWANYLRAKYRQHVDSLEQIEDFSHYTENAVSKYEALSLAERAVEYIDKLPESQKIIAKLRFIEEKSVQEVAEQLGRSKLYIKTTQHRAVKNLRKMFKDPAFRSAS